MITARNAEIDKVAGLDVGADDYITKPFSIPELMARIRAVLRRYGDRNESVDEYIFGKIRLDFKSLKAYRDEKEIKLTLTEFEIMKYFINHAGEVIHRHDFLNNVWGYDKVPTTRTVDNFIFDLRKKLEEDPSNPVHIKSIRGVGYMFIPAPPDDTMIR
jgi:DNA-binding response OmpR family regulator